MATLGNSLITTSDLIPKWRPGGSSKFLDQSLMNCSRKNLSFKPNHHLKSKTEISKRQVAVQASLSGNSGCSNSASIFIGGFLLGGLIVGALGCVYAPKINNAFAGTDKNDIMKKLPKFIYDEEKALEKTRKTLEQKIAQLNSAIDGVSSEIRADGGPNESVSASDEIEAAI